MKNIKGFTLIELLVAVLIIGILAAIALPQYQKTVERSKISEAIQLGRRIKDAQEIYYLIEGKYTSSFEDLDIDTNFGTLNASKNQITTEKFSITLDPNNSRVYMNPRKYRYYDSLSFCFGTAKSAICKPTLGRIVCSAYSNNPKQVAFCKSLNPNGASEVYSAWTLNSLD
jgi:type IV pilus assembly protein PilE